TTITDNRGNATTLTYTTSGQLLKIDSPVPEDGVAAQSVQFSYTSSGDLSAVTDGNGYKTYYTYDSSGNCIYVLDPSNHAISYTYDANNNLLTEARYFDADPDGVGANKPSQAATTRYVYNGNRLIYTVSATGEVTQHNYDGYGRETSTIVF